MGQTAAWTRYLAYFRESSYASETLAGGASVRRIDIVGESLAHRAERREVVPEQYGSVERALDTGARAEGPVDVLPDFTRIGHFVAHLMGTPTTVNPAGAAYVHTWYHNPQYNPASLCLDLHPDVRIHRFPGSVGRTLRFGTEQARHFAMSIGWLCQREKTPASSSIPSIDEALFPTPLAPGAPGGPTFALTLAIDGVGYDGSGHYSSDFTWDRIFRAPEQNQLPVGVIDRGRVACKGNLRWFYQSDTAVRYEAFRDFKKFATTASWTGSAIGVTGYNQRLLIELPNCYVPSVSGPQVRSSGGPNTLELDTSFVARYDTTTRGPVRIELINTDPAPAGF